MQLTTILLQALALSTAAAGIVARQNDCQATYNDCLAAGRPEVACGCDLAACFGEDNARNRDFCASATANLTKPTATPTSSSASIIVGTPGSQPSGQAPITAPEGSLALGAPCSDTRQCANGAQCFGSTAFTIRTCGSFNAACTMDSQCATNTCNNGLCNGYIAKSSSTVAPSKTSSTASVIVGTPGSQPSGQAPITAAEGSLKLGELCSDSRQCATVDGKAVDCFGSTAFTIRRCGNFNGLCQVDGQCAYNTCNNGLCNGFVPTSSAAPAPTTMATSIKACKIKTVYID